MDSKTLATKALFTFIDAFNSMEKDRIINQLHFPHATHSDGLDPIIYTDPDQFWTALQPQLVHMKKFESWSYSTLDQHDIIHVAPQTVQFMVTFSRRHADHQAYGTAKGLWIVTCKHQHWRLQMRSMFPASGTISALAGQSG